MNKVYIKINTPDMLKRFLAVWLKGKASDEAKQNLFEAIIGYTYDTIITSHNEAGIEYLNNGLNAINMQHMRNSENFMSEYVDLFNVVSTEITTMLIDNNILESTVHCINVNDSITELEFLYMN